MLREKANLEGGKESGWVQNCTKGREAERKRKIKRRRRGGERERGGIAEDTVAKFSSSNVQSVVRRSWGRGRVGGGRRKTALFAAKQKDRPWSDDYSPFTGATGI